MMKAKASIEVRGESAEEDERYRPTVATIDLDALAHNYRQIRSFTEPAEVLAIVKADAYGHGAVPCARVLEREGAAFLGVALVEEGLELRRAGIGSPILVLGGAFGRNFEVLLTHRLTPMIFQQEHLERLAAAARATGLPAEAHLKVDTGMGRLGIQPRDLCAFLDAAAAHGVALTGIATHFANADLRDHALTQRQVVTMQDAVELLRSRGQTPRWIHMANSAASVSLPAAHGTLVRPGIMLYGAYPSEAYHDRIALRPVMRWSTAIAHLKEVPAGTPISYGSKWVASKPSRIATLPVGYADGLQRRLTNIGSVLIRGRRVPIAGTVCMDQCMVDVSDLPEVAVGDEAVLLGEQQGATLPAHEVAALCGTIHYEIFCGIGPRVPRRFVGGSSP